MDVMKPGFVELFVTNFQKFNELGVSDEIRRANYAAGEPLFLKKRWLSSDNSRRLLDISETEQC